MSGWTQERIENLRELVALGRSASQIGKVIGVSRNAVIGKARRMGLALGALRQKPATPGQASPRAQVKQIAVAARRREAKIVVARVAKSAFVIPKAPATEAQITALDESRRDAQWRFAYAATFAVAPRPWLLRNTFECAYPIERNEEVWSCCNAVPPSGEGEAIPAYCAAHAGVMFKKAKAA